MKKSYLKLYHIGIQVGQNRILEIFPETTLPMNDEDRKFKYGQFGYGKYLYNKEDLTDMKEFLWRI